MNYTGSVERGQLRNPGEISRLVSARESDAVGHLWKSARQSQDAAHHTRNIAAQVKQQLSRVNRGTVAPFAMHPFKIYQFPPSLRNYHSDNDWRRVKVRNGGIINQDRGVIDGSDGAKCPENGLLLEDGIPGASGYQDTNQFVQPDGTQVSYGQWNELAVSYRGTPNVDNLWYIWLTSILDTSAGGGQPLTTSLVMASVNAASTDVLSFSSGETLSDQLQAYSTLGTDDPYHVCIGSVEADLDTGFPPRLIIKQRLFGNVTGHFIPNPYLTWETFSDYTITCQPTRLRGQYNAAEKYFWGDTVLVTETSGPHTALATYVMIPPNGTTYNPILGPITGISPTTNTPDPWHLLSRSPIGGNWVTAAYDATKSYFRFP